MSLFNEQSKGLHNSFISGIYDFLYVVKNLMFINADRIISVEMKCDCALRLLSRCNTADCNTKLPAAFPIFLSTQKHIIIYECLSVTVNLSINPLGTESNALKQSFNLTYCVFYPHKEKAH